MAQIKKRADGRYLTQVYLGRDEDGRKKYKSIYARSIPELKEKEAAVRMDLGRGLDVMAQRDSFDVWADGWIRLKEREEISSRQLDHYRVAVRRWKEEFESYEIGEIRADDIERILLDLVDQGLAQRTVSFYRSTLRQIMERAVGRVISSNPVNQVKLSAVGRREEKRRALTAEEQNWIWDTPHRAQPVAVIMMLSGLRRGELAALTWDDVNIQERTITVCKAVRYEADRTPTIQNMTKTEAGLRTVDIPQRLADYMAAMPRTGQLVIPSAKGGIMTESAWVKLWNSYLRVLNEKYGERTPEDLKKLNSSKPGPKVLDFTIPRFTLHWLRHTFCTLLYLAGVDVVTARAQMGHADISTTLRIYTHLDSMHKRKAVDKLDAYLNEANRTEKEDRGQS